MTKPKVPKVPKAPKVPKVKVPRAKKEPAANDLRRIEKIKLEMPDRVRRLRETNVTRNDIVDAQVRAGHAAELNRLHGQSGMLHGNVPGHVAQRIMTLAGGLGHLGQPYAGTAHYPGGIQPRQY